MSDRYKAFKESSINKLDHTKYKIDRTLMKVFIQPFCDKYKLNFMSGMGICFFLNHNRKQLIDDRERVKNKSSFLKEFYSLTDLIWRINQETNMLGTDYNSN